MAVDASAVGRKRVRLFGPWPQARGGGNRGLHPNQVPVAKILETVEGAFPTEWDKILAAARGLGATEACLEASNTLALPESRPPPALPTGEGGGGANGLAVGTSSADAQGPTHQLGSINGGGEDEDGENDPDDPCAQEAPAAERQRPPTPPHATPPAIPRVRGRGEF